MKPKQEWFFDPNLREIVLKRFLNAIENYSTFACLATAVSMKS